MVGFFEHEHSRPFGSRAILMLSSLWTGSADWKTLEGSRRITDALVVVCNYESYE